MSQYNCIVVLGATATGKTALAVKLAQAKHGEIISADSRQVYRRLDLGTGKDLQEYGSIPYHLIDVCDLSCEFTVFHFQQEVYRIFPQLIKKGTLPVIAGGTGLYLDAILRGYELIPVPEDPSLRKTLATKTLPELQDMLIALKPDIHNKTDLEQPNRLVRAIEIARYRQMYPESIERRVSDNFCVSGFFCTPSSYCAGKRNAACDIFGRGVCGWCMLCGSGVCSA